MIKELGNGSTYNTDLNRVCKHLWGSKFKGVLSSDNDIPKTGYCIVNTDPSYLPGKHWIAICNGLVYDSFGRKTKKLVPNMKGSYTDTEYDAEQKESESNCGSRCCAWIHVYDTLGRDAARLI
jgi:hypothetical protein